ncbi:unnamed protein product [Strongylus vulgaris]|uniref:Uncharacterized protein n=1 Tax=Strongylus vulgaris TaxID=40348 RepID=A0A3P7JSS5_STRVU|nr:unnamed protein product [Strongylus vulgaris]
MCGVGECVCQLRMNTPEVGVANRPRLRQGQTDRIVEDDRRERISTMIATKGYGITGLSIGDGSIVIRGEGFCKWLG